MDRAVHSKPYKELQALLIAAREEAKLTQAQVGERIGQTQSFVSKCERGERRLDVVEFVEFVKALGLDPSAFFAQFLEQAFSGTHDKKL